MSPEQIHWKRTGSLFWLASELRKTRLFFAPEKPTQDRVLDGLEQALHHAKKLGCNQYVTREIERSIKDVKTIGFNKMTPKIKKHHINRLRVAMNNIAGLAEQHEEDFEAGPRAAHPAPRNNV